MLNLMEGSSCPRCISGILVLKSSKLTAKRQRNPYHFCKTLSCNKCKYIKLLNKYRKLKGEKCDCVKTIHDKQDQLTIF